MEQASNLERNQLWRRQQADARRDAWATSARGVTPPLVKRKTERRAEQRRRQSLRASAASQSAGGGDDLDEEAPAARPKPTAAPGMAVVAARDVERSSTDGDLAAAGYVSTAVARADPINVRVEPVLSPPLAPRQPSHSPPRERSPRRRLAPVPKRMPTAVVQRPPRERSPRRLAPVPKRRPTAVVQRPPWRPASERGIRLGLAHVHRVALHSTDVTCCMQTQDGAYWDVRRFKDKRHGNHDGRNLYIQQRILQKRDMWFDLLAEIKERLRNAQDHNIKLFFFATRGRTAL